MDLESARLPDQSVESSAAPRAPEISLRSRAVRGAAFSFLRFGGVQALRLLSNLVIARLLAPEAFGLLALVSVLIQALEMFSDFGFQPAIIRSARGNDPKFLDTAWTLQVVRGFAIWAIACLAAWPFSRFYGEPVLALVIPVLGAMSAINGFSAMKRHTLNRDLHLGRLSIVELSAQATGIAVTIGLALLWPNAWSLVLGSLLTTALRALLSFVALPGRNHRFAFDRHCAHELFGFGRWIMVSTALTFTAQFADRLIFGKLVTLDLLGVYSIARMISAMPADALASIASSVVFPVYSRIVERGESLASVFARVRRPVLILGGCALSMLAGGGAALIEVLYDHRYVLAGPIVQLLAIGTWFHLLEATNGGALLTLGQSKWVAAGTGAKTLGLVALIPIGFTLDGLRGAIVGLVAADLLKYATSCHAIARQGMPVFRIDLPLNVWFAASSACVYLGAMAFESHFLGTLAAGVIGGICWSPFALPFIQRLRARRREA